MTRKSWKEKVIDGVQLQQQVQAALNAEGLKMPATPRRPDVRVILNNIDGMGKIFTNPGNHGNDKAESIPASGEKTAAMAMVKGETQEEQLANAALLFATYDLENEGLSKAFVDDLVAGKLKDLISEIYGPAPYTTMVGKLTSLTWEKEDGSTVQLDAVKGAGGSYGPRPPETQTVFEAQFPIAVFGTSSIAEAVTPLSSIFVKFSEDWATKKLMVDPIAASVAPTFYGAHTANIPTAKFVNDQLVSLDLKNGTVLQVAAEDDAAETPVLKKAVGGLKR